METWRRGPLPSRERLAFRWGFLEREPDACAVVTRRMEVVYLNAAASSLVKPGWFGSQCWDVLLVEEAWCPAGCPVVGAVFRADDIIYCEETIRAHDGSPVPVGIAAIPVRVPCEEGEQALLLLRPAPPDAAREVFRRELLERAGKLRAFYESLQGVRRDHATGEGE
jgi:hypothetical protein